MMLPGIKNFAVEMSAIVKKGDCTIKMLVHLFNYLYIYRGITWNCLILDATV